MNEWIGLWVFHMNQRPYSLFRCGARGAFWDVVSGVVCDWTERRTFTAQGARFLKERPWTRLWRWMVYSRVTTSSNALRLPVYPK